MCTYTQIHALACTHRMCRKPDTRVPARKTRGSQPQDEGSQLQDGGVPTTRRGVAPGGVKPPSHTATHSLLHPTHPLCRHWTKSNLPPPPFFRPSSASSSNSFVGIALRYVQEPAPFGSKRWPERRCCHQHPPPPTSTMRIIPDIVDEITEKITRITITETTTNRRRPNSQRQWLDPATGNANNNTRQWLDPAAATGSANTNTSANRANRCVAAAGGLRLLPNKKLLDSGCFKGLLHRGRRHAALVRGGPHEAADAAHLQLSGSGLTLQAWLQRRAARHIRLTGGRLSDKARPVHVACCAIYVDIVTICAMCTVSSDGIPGWGDCGVCLFNY